MPEQSFQKKIHAEKNPHHLSIQKVLSRRSLLKGGFAIGGAGLLGLGGTLLWRNTQHQDSSLYTFHRSVYGATWSPNGKNLAILTAEGDLLICDTSSYAVIHSDSVAGNMPTGAISWSPDGQYIASSDQNHAIRIWNVSTWSSITDISSNQTIVDAVSWSPDSELVAVGSANKRVNIYRSATHSFAELVFTYEQHLDGITTLAWSPDGQYIASGSLDGTVRMWAPSTGSTHATFTDQSSHPITALAWSPDNQMIALTFGPKEDNLQPLSNYPIQVLHALSGAIISTYKGHNNYVESLAWSSNGAYVASASDDTTVRIWRPKQAQEIYIYRGHTARVKNVVWAPDNIHLATASEDKTFQIWKRP